MTYGWRCAGLPLLCGVLLAGLWPMRQGWAQEGTVLERWRERRQAAAAPADEPAPIRAAGDYSFKFMQGGQSRRYLVHVPNSYRPDTPMPVLLAFHGGGGHAELQADDARYGLISLSESAGFIAVFPNGYSAFPGGRLATWNAGACCGHARDQQIDDVGFVRALWARLQQQLNVDARRVYATGMSNGGMLTHRLACEMADVLAGIAAVAGTDNTLRCTPARPIPVLMIHARDDDHVLYEGGAGAAAFRDAAKVSDFTSVPQTVARWVSRNQCQPTPTRVLQQPGAYCERYAGCSEGVQVQLCVTETGGHSWPGAGEVRRGKAPASQALSANAVMWAFFSRL